MLSRATITRPRISGAGRRAAAARHATAAAALARASGWYRPRSSRHAFRVAATSIVLTRTTAAPPHRTQAVAAGVRPLWACVMRLTIAAPIAAMAAVSGRWASTQDRLAVGWALGGRRPTKSKYVHLAPN